MELAGVVATMQHVWDRMRRLTRFGILAVGVGMGVILPALVFLAKS